MAVLQASPAYSATLSEQRATLRQASYAAAQNYVDSRAYIPLLARPNGVAVKDAIASGKAALTTVGDALTVATTQSAMDAVAVRMKAEVLRAATVKKSGQQLVELKNLRSGHQKNATAALADFLAGGITSAAYQAMKTRAAAYSTQLSADAVRQLGVLGKAVAAPALIAPKYRTVLEQGSGSIPVASGWVGFPGAVRCQRHPPLSGRCCQATDPVLRRTGKYYSIRRPGQPRTPPPGRFIGSSFALQ
ncbi:hypothetical protein PJ267_00965 [Arthrobacter sp. OVS8]|nr:hypothetical protein PJ267_00965 [Arthrobacter sp. OVS8]